MFGIRVRVGRVNCLIMSPSSVYKLSLLVFLILAMMMHYDCSAITYDQCPEGTGRIYYGSNSLCVICELYEEITGNPC